jgi:large subunit ribosomal protein L5
MNILRYHYNNVIKYDIITKLKNETTSKIPNLKKIVLNFGKKEINFKLLLSFIAALELISNQTALITKAGNSNISLKIRKGAPIGCKVTLRKDQLYSFLFNTVSQIFIHIKQFNGFIINYRIQKSKVFSFKINDVLNFTVIENQYELFKNMSKLDISVVTSCKNTDDLSVLLSSFRFPLK